MNHVWRGLAGAVVGLHFAYLLYLIVGGFLSWRWPRTIVLHLVAALWAVLIVVTRVPCPLTWLQNTLRARAGQPPLVGGFIDIYIRGTFYPATAQAVAQTVVGILVLASWLGFVRRCGMWRRWQGDASSDDATAQT